MSIGNGKSNEKSLKIAIQKCFEGGDADSASTLLAEYLTEMRISISQVQLDTVLIKEKLFGSEKTNTKGFIAEVSPALRFYRRFMTILSFIAAGGFAIAFFWRELLAFIRFKLGNHD